MDSTVIVNKPTDRSIIDIGLDRVDEAAELLTTVFLDYPLDHYILADLGPERRSVLAKSFRMDCLWKLGMGWSCLGVLMEGKLAAVALVVGCTQTQGGAIWYDKKPLTLSRLQEMENQLNRTFGGQTHARILEYYALKESGAPRSPHLYLESLGTLPEWRGKNIGSMLIRHISRMSEEDPLSTGVALDTQDPVNLDLYRHFGYQLTGEGDIGSVHTWFMFRPNTPPAV